MNKRDRDLAEHNIRVLTLDLDSRFGGSDWRKATENALKYWKSLINSPLKRK